MKTKAAAGVKVLDEDQGIVRVIFATLNVKDHDGDVTLPGAFEQGGRVRVSAWNHTSWKGAPPTGRGVIREEGDAAIADLKFFLSTAHGRDAFEVVKELGDLQEWSYGFQVLDAEHGEFQGERVQFLKRLKVYEVSPVLLGAGRDTRTLATRELSVGNVWAAGTGDASERTASWSADQQPHPDYLHAQRRLALARLALSASPFADDRQRVA